MNKKELFIEENNLFEYLGTKYNCEYAIKHDTKDIFREAEVSHKEEFEKHYDKNTLVPYRVVLYLDSNDKPMFGMIIYTIKNRTFNYDRLACGNYYPIWEGNLIPHNYQASICW